MATVDNVMVVLMLVAVVIAVVFLPTIVAKVRQHNNFLAIGVLNAMFIIVTIASILTLGLLSIPVVALTPIAWVIALVWACTSNVQPAQV